MSKVTFGSKVASKATACGPKTINYNRHPDGKLSRDGVMLTEQEQAMVERQLIDQAKKQ